MYFYPRSLLLPSLDSIILLDIYHYNLALILLAKVLFDVSISEDARHDVKWWPVLHSVQCGGGGGGGHVGCPQLPGRRGSHSHLTLTRQSHTSI